MVPHKQMPQVVYLSVLYVGMTIGIDKLYSRDYIIIYGIAYRYEYHSRVSC